MQYLINAWLEKGNPALKIIDPQRQKVIKEFQGQELEELIEHGDIVPDELQTNNPSQLKSMVDELLGNFYQVPKPVLYNNCPAYRSLLGLVEKAKFF